jgi:geranylgeranyl reductase family protein|tara:strand:+ start:886 stop:2028 length:1143 start_codon:yes stop_codon:yes gene_type:complete
MKEYDVVVAGGSISGLLTAREVAKNGNSVLVLEEGFEIGTPDHCGGLVSKTALDDLGITPSQKTFDGEINSAQIFSPSGKNIRIDSKKQNVVVVNRRELDKQAAMQAQKLGAEIMVNTSYKMKIDGGVRTSIGDINCKVVVDCCGVSSVLNSDRNGILQSAQYEVYGDWIHDGKVEVHIDQKKYPEFFAWVIPSSDGIGKVGVAGKEINVLKTMEDFLSSKGNCSIIRKIYAPIWINGPIKKFTDENLVTVGDAAGQAKPTTAGGIYSCGMGGIIAGNTITKFLETKQISDLKEYQKIWIDKFGKEFEKQIMARKLLHRLDNNSIDKIFSQITPDIIKEISEKDDFDFHTSSIIKMLGLKNSVSVAQTIIGGEIKKLLHS